MTETKIDDQKKETLVPDDSKVEHTAQFKGAMANKNDKISGLRDDKSALQQEIADLRAAAAVPQPEPDELESMDADDLVTESRLDSKLDREIKALRKEIDDRNKEDRNKDMNLRFQRSETKAKQDFTVEKRGDGLDYETVISLGKANLTKGDQLNIQNAEDPALEAYEACIRRNPALKQRSDGQRKQTLVSKLNDEISGTSSKDKIHGGQRNLTAQDMQSLLDTPDSQLEEILMERDD